MNSLPTPAATMAGPEQAATGTVGEADLALHVVGEAVWAPSVHNTQPWWFTADSGGLSLYADPARQLAVADPAGLELLISRGAALFTARLTLRAAGYVPRTGILPDPAQPLLIARLDWPDRAAPSEHERRLAAQVRSRRSHRGAFGPLPLAQELLTVLQECARRHDAVLRVVTDEGTRAALADVVQAAERALRADSAHVRELVAWTSPPGAARDDGVPATAYPARPERTFPLHILLTGAAWGVAAALHSQPFEACWGRELIRYQPGPYPQLLLRLGTTVQVAASVRRPPDSVLVS